MNLGVDLGSTYSSFSTYDIVNKNVELCKPVMSEPEAIPSIACLNDDGKMLTGYTARKYIQLDDPSARTFSAFKMLLTESNEKLLQERGFGTDYTPSAVAETFLRDQVNKILSSHADPGVDNLVICAPEVWTTQSAVRRGQLDGRTILRDICSRIPGVDRDRIRIVSEPAAASAYFAYQYRRAVGSNFNGCLLIVDYGGGTLDLTLTEVHPQDASVEIKVLFRTGAGENVQGRTGNAGIAYMEHAVHLALEEGGCDPAELLPCRPEFRKAVDVLEDRLMEQISPNTPDQAGSVGEDYRKLWDTVDECGADLSDLLNNDETFAAIRYGGKRYPVTYAHLMRAYRAVVEPELGKCLQETADWMRARRYDYKNPNTDAFHIVLVGGFGKFLLVQKQVEWFFHRPNTGDRRFQHGLGQDREYAVSKGAALLASGVMTIRRTAPFGIGIYSEADDRLHYAIMFRQEFKPGQEHWIRVGGPDTPPVKFVNSENTIPQLLIGSDENPQAGTILPLLPAMCQRIARAYAQMDEYYRTRFPGHYPIPLHNIGFSMDESEVVSLLLRSVDMNGKPLLTLPPVELASYSQMFGLAEARTIDNSGRKEK